MPHDRHLIDLPMAAVATHPAVHVNGVIEINIVRCLVDLYPRDRFSRSPTAANDLQLRALFFNLCVTGHASLRGRDAGRARDLNRLMAITAVDAELVHVEGMIKAYGLDWLITHSCVFRSEIIGYRHRSHGA